MAVAQGPPAFLLDEPTAYLDLVHQIDVLDLVGRHDTPEPEEPAKSLA
ncbi:hypothetical protein GCM10010253_23650 [Streptomyces badius]|uniref:Uncharacterized protein n=1 Tax=Streptomyces badius TaxID=1941 RepID=A0ABQ2T2D5_STRBA|nr:hypothetical protein GCM10010253_23650 [Streptomyces badius]